MNDELFHEIQGLECNIDSVIDYMTTSDSDIATVDHIKSIIPQIQRILPYEKEGVLINGKKPSEYLSFFNRKIAEYQDKDNIFENLRMAFGLDNTDLTKDYEFEVIAESFEKCKNSDNVYDKFALAIYYKNMGEQYRTAALSLFKEISEINPSNPIMTPVQVLFYIAEFQNECKQYIDSMRTYQKLFHITPNNPIIYERLVDIFIKIDCRDIAVEAINSAKKTKYYREPYFKSVIDSIKI